MKKGNVRAFLLMFLADWVDVLVAEVLPCAIADPSLHSWVVLGNVVKASNQNDNHICVYGFDVEHVVIMKFDFK